MTGEPSGSAVVGPPSVAVGPPSAEAGSTAANAAQPAANGGAISPSAAVAGADSAPRGAAGTFSDTSWRRAVVSAGRLEADRPDLVPVGLIGFLVRGGLLLFLVPILVLPTPIGIANFVGASAITASGPAPWFVDMLIALALIVIVLLIATTIVGTLTDLFLLRSVMAANDGAELRLGVGLVVRASVIRLVALVPFVLAAAFGIASLARAAYGELVTPADTATPFALRVLLQAANAAVVVVVAWLIGETIGGLAVRHLAISSVSLPRALWRGATDLVRRPITTLATLVVSVLAIVAAVVPALIVTITVWGQMPGQLERLTSVRSFLVVLLMTMLFVAAWVAGLVLAGLVATWRSVLWDLEVLRTRPLRIPVTPAASTGRRPQADPRPVGDRAGDGGESPVGSGEPSHTMESGSS